MATPPVPEAPSTNPISKIFGQTVLGYALQAGSGAYVFKDGTRVETPAGIITNWAPKHLAELQENVDSGLFREVFTTAEIKTAYENHNLNPKGF